jgi:large subunit ribosomal protein L25
MAGIAPPVSLRYIARFAGPGGRLLAFTPKDTPGMANFVTIEAETRERSGTGAARATRRAGKVPGVIYGARQTPTNIALDPRIILRELQRGGWRSRLYELNVSGAPTRALIRDVQFHPVSDAPEHIDFQRLAPGERIRVSVAVHFVGELTSPGLKRGGVLNVVRHVVEVLCDPEHVPEHFEADLGSLDINDNVRFSDLKGTGEARPTITDRDFVIATVASPSKLPEAVADPNAPTAAAAAPAKGAAPAKAAGPAKGAAPAKAAPAKAAPAKPAAKAGGKK